jgi:ubiquitin carboxyl-terminal hydrolase 8
MLFDYMRLYDILLIDVRSRTEFDDGHIDHSRIMCVEPLTIRIGMSAEELQGSLILSPDLEQAMFDRRGRYEMVVYYDQSTPTSAFLSRTDLSAKEESLKILYDALVEFNIEHPLRRPPLLLEGGLDAWTELLGLPALKTSNTAETKAQKAMGPKRKPVPIPLQLPELTVEKKRRGTFNPLDAEEARRWEEKARAESLPLELMPPTEEEVEEEDEEINASYYRATDDFLRRFPAVDVEPESMVRASQFPQYPTPSRPAPPPPSSYPAQAQATTSDLPAIPSRPPPAAPRVSYSGAHERAVAPYAQNQRVSQLRPYVPPKDMPQNIRLPRTGLINFGVTCYMNATIQCLSATLPLTRIIRDGSYRRYIQRDNWKGSKGLLPEHYANLIHHLWKDDVTACRPTTFRSFCARLNDTWGKNEQQDAKEFYDFVIDFLHEDMNIAWRNPPPHVLSPSEEQIRERMHPAYASMIEWSRWSKRDRSPISDLFAGQHASRLKCLACGTTSTTYETFYSISIEIPRSGVGHIYACLDSYCQEEKLAKGWKCPSCKKERDATKRIFITRAPRNLVVHFKRFESLRDGTRKVRTPIEFPLEGLDIAAHMQTPPSAEDTDATVRATGDANIRNMRLDESMVPPFVYDAYGVIRHIGASINRGHYIASVRDPGRNRWRMFNDERVGDFDPDVLQSGDRLQNEEAYILFFERRMGPL